MTERRWLIFVYFLKIVFLFEAWVSVCWAVYHQWSLSPWREPTMTGWPASSKVRYLPSLIPVHCTVRGRGAFRAANYLNFWGNFGNISLIPQDIVPPVGIQIVYLIWPKNYSFMLFSYVCYTFILAVFQWAGSYFAIFVAIGWKYFQMGSKSN
jgi:hypothetical protein